MNEIQSKNLKQLVKARKSQLLNSRGQKIISELAVT
jgi:helix-turn-helix protein